MRWVTFAMASVLAAVAMLWVAATNWRRFVADGEAGTSIAEGIGLGLLLLYALGAVFALTRPLGAIVTFGIAAVLGVGAGLLSDVADLVVLGASAVLPAASSAISARGHAETSQ